MTYRNKILILLLIGVVTLLWGCWQKPPPEVILDPPNGDFEPDINPPDQNYPEPELAGALLVIIENNSASRPQSGLDQADVVYEMLSEGNITRFLACFYQQAPEKIGPVRSIRTPYAEIAKAYDSPLAHAGGSAEGLAAIQNLRIKNLDEIYNSSRSFWRATDRPRPHNLYTSAERMLSGAERRNLSLTPMPTLTIGSNAGGAFVNSLEVTYSRSTRSPYATQFVYKDGRYYKQINSEPFLSDRGQPIAADNVIVLFIRTTYEMLRGTTYANIHLIDSGQAVFFNQGKMYEGTWTKKSPSSHFSYTIDEDPFFYSEGQTWILIVPSSKALTYKIEPPPADSTPEL